MLLTLVSLSSAVIVTSNLSSEKMPNVISSMKEINAFSFTVIVPVGALSSTSIVPVASLLSM